MTVTSLTDRRPGLVRFNGTAKGLALAFGVIQNHELADCTVLVVNDGQDVVLDYTGTNGAAGHVRRACQALEIVVEELAAETTDGAAAVELKGFRYRDGGVGLTVRAVVPIPATWPSP